MAVGVDWRSSGQLYWNNSEFLKILNSSLTWSPRWSSSSWRRSTISRFLWSDAMGTVVMCFNGTTRVSLLVNWIVRLLFRKWKKRARWWEECWHFQSKNLSRCRPSCIRRRCCSILPVVQWRQGMRSGNSSASMTGPTSRHYTTTTAEHQCVLKIDLLSYDPGR